MTTLCRDDSLTRKMKKKITFFSVHPAEKKLELHFLFPSQQFKLKCLNFQVGRYDKTSFFSFNILTLISQANEYASTETFPCKYIKSENETECSSKHLLDNNALK